MNDHDDNEFHQEDFHQEDFGGNEQQPDNFNQNDYNEDFNPNVEDLPPPPQMEIDHQEDIQEYTNDYDHATAPTQTASASTGGKRKIKFAKPDLGEMTDHLKDRMDDLVQLDSSNKKGSWRRNKVLIEILPKWSPIVVFAVFVLVFGITAIIGAFTAPNYIYLDHAQVHSGNTSSIYDGSSLLVAEITGLKKINEAVFFTLTPANNFENSTGFTKTDLALNVTLFGRNSENEEYQRINAREKTYVRTLTCVQGIRDCNEIFVFRTKIKFSQYRVEALILNAEDLWENGFFQDYLTAGFAYIDIKYTIYEIIWRYVFVAMGAVATIIYIILMFVMLRFKAFPTNEQTWVLILLIYLNIYNNPIYMVEYIVDSFIFPLLDSVFVASFFAVTLICILIFVHSLVKTPSERGIFKFYIPKFVLLGLWWFVSIGYFTYNAIQSTLDPSFSAEQSPWYIQYLQFAWIGLLAVYAFQIFFYFVRLISNFKVIWKRGLTVKFICIFFLTGIVIIVGTAAVVVMFIFNFYFNNGVYVLARALMNYYVIWFAFLFIPTRVQDMSYVEEVKAPMLKSDANADASVAPTAPATEHIEDF